MSGRIVLPNPGPSGPDEGAGEVVSSPAPAAFSPDWQTGTRFSTYEIDSLLASGGMAEVWRARLVGMEGFEKRVVIKTMLTRYQNRPDLVDMFVKEASLAARLSHPNIVDVIDFGQIDGRYFIAMEYVAGMSLRFIQKQLRAQGRTLPVAAALHVARDVCEALQYMHDLEDAEGPLGLVHRDLSADNIILSTSGTAKLIDFGAARATARTPMSKVFIGRLRYAAPERLRHVGEDHRSDIYSLGVILYEWLVGSRPFEGSDEDVVRAATSSVCCDPREQMPALDPQVADVVKKATAADPAERYATAQAMGTALARCLVKLRATNKEREVTGALAALLGAAARAPLPRATTSARPGSRSPVPPERSPDVPAPVRPSPPLGARTLAAAEAVPESVASPERASSSDMIALNDREMWEASGPVRDGAVPLEIMPAADTKKTSLPVPPEAFPAQITEEAPLSETPGHASVAGRRRARIRTLPAIPTDRAAVLFDQGVKLRLEGRYEDALMAWEMALQLAPDNHLYEAQVASLRAYVEGHPRR